MLLSVENLKVPYGNIQALHLANRGYVPDTGEIVAEGTSDDLLGNPEVKKAYLEG